MKNLILLVMILVLASCATAKKELKPEYSETSDYHYILAVEAEMSNDWDEALKQLKLALRSNPESTYLMTEISQIYLRLDRLDDAIKTVEEVLIKSPEYKPALSLLSKLYTSNKEYSKTIKIYKRLIYVTLYLQL